MADMAGLLVAAVLALLLAGCARQDDEPMPAACFGAPATFVQALERAPAAVRLAGATRLSTCVSRAHDDGELQALGRALTAAADTLRGRIATDPSAAAGLGYLTAAVQAGVATNQGFATQLGRKVDGATALPPGASPAARAALASGLRAGASGG